MLCRLKASVVLRFECVDVRKVAGSSLFEVIRRSFVQVLLLAWRQEVKSADSLKVTDGFS